ncbi:hypothetical protein B7463_g3093, partial [Scytalidium lignicola]
MDIDTDDEILRSLADGQTMDYSQWPALLSRLIPRLEKIVTTEFPLPSFSNRPPSQSQTSSSLPQSSPPLLTSQPDTSTPNAAKPSSQESTTSTDSTNKENNPPPVSQATTATTITSSTSTIPAGTLPPEVRQLLISIIDTLQSLFSTYPPHTIQRLAELLLMPRTHHRSLPAYLHALDRVVHVTSGANIFPLPPAVPDPLSSSSVLLNGPSTRPDPLSISWGNPTSQLPNSNFGGDESLGGALLTPIPWLRNDSTMGDQVDDIEAEVRTESTETIDGPNGVGGIETVSVSVNGVSSPRESRTGNTGTSAEASATGFRAEGAVTQGELLRQEQRAGVIPAAQLEDTDAEGLGEEDEVPHARGPEEIGMEDMGPQSHSTSSPLAGMQGIDLEAAVGRRAEITPDDEGNDDTRMDMDVERETPKREAEEDLASEGKRLREDDNGKENADNGGEEKGGESSIEDEQTSEI